MDIQRACEILNINLSDRNNKVLIKKKYKRACLKYHPDKNGDETKFIEIKEAYDFLNTKHETFMDQFDESLLRKYAYLFHTLKNPIFRHPLFIKYVINPIEKHLSEYKTYVLNPTLENLLNKDIYYLEEEHVYVPLWHHEIIFDKKIKVLINPLLDMKIDDDNNLYIRKDQLPLFGISILTNEIKIVGKGIPRIQSNIYDASILSDIFILP